MKSIDADESLALLTSDEVAALFRQHPTTLRIARSRGTLPLPHVRIGRCVRYRLVDVQQFIQQRLTVNGG
jgi:hypothetical protein